MVDFKRLRQESTPTELIKPEDIFLRLPKSPGINDLWKSQAEALEQWFNRRTERDIVIKLNTGGGKTLVGLLIAQSIMNEKRGPVLYLSPVSHLVSQTIDLAKRYGIHAVAYQSGKEFPERFLSGQAVMVSTYAALFNGLSCFGLSGGGKRHCKARGPHFG